MCTHVAPRPNRFGGWKAAVSLRAWEREAAHGLHSACVSRPICTLALLIGGVAQRLRCPRTPCWSIYLPQQLVPERRIPAVQHSRSASFAHSLISALAAVMQTRSRRGETLDLGAWADWPLIESTGTRLSVLRDLAAKYSLSVRREATIDVVRAHLLRHFATLGIPHSAAPSGRALAVASPARPASSSPVAASSSPVAASMVAAQQQPAAQQRLQQPAHAPASAAAASEQPASAPHDAAPCTQHTSISQRATYPAQLALLQEVANLRAQVADANAEVHRLSACNSQLQTDLTLRDEQIVRLVSQATQAQGPVAPAQHSPAQPAAACSRSAERHADAAASCATPPPAASSPPAAATAAVPAASAAPARLPAAARSSQQHRPAAQPGGFDWVFSGLGFAAGSSREVAHAAASAFAEQQLSMADAASSLQVLRVSDRSDGLAVIRLPDRAVERSLRSAKAALPRSCGVCIFRSLPPEQRGAAAQLRRAERQLQLLTAEEVATARRTANAAVEFALQRIAGARGRRASGPIAFSPAPVLEHLGTPSCYSVLHDEPVSSASAGAAEASLGDSPATPPAAPAATTTTTTSTAHIDAC